MRYILSPTLISAAVYCVIANLNIASAAPLAACPSTGNKTTISASGKTDSTDTNIIQTAINNMATLSGGGTVLVSAGTYSLPSATLILKPNVTLCAPNRAVFKRTAATFGYILDTGNTDGIVANNTGLVNLTFDGGPIALRGNNLRVESNIFQNVKRSDAEVAANVDPFGRFGLWLRAASASTITNNDFINLEYGGIFGHSITSNSTISSNTFNKVSEPIHLFCASDLSISKNTMSQLTRMGIEIQIDSNPAEPAKYPACTTNPRVTITRNVINGWLPSNPQNLITAISTEKLAASYVTYNTATCGAGCNNLDPTIPSLGLEISTSDSTPVASNTITGFNIGIQINDANKLGIINNAIYDTNSAIIKAGNAPALSSLTINYNYIVNAQSKGIDGNWGLTTNPVINGNTIIRTAGKWNSDITRSGDASYVAIKAGNTANGSLPLSIKSNKVLFMGSAVSGFETRGIMLTGTPAGLTLDGNWIGWIGSATQTAYGNGIQINNENASKSVNLTNNVFQNLTLLTSGWECLFTATGNNAINMTSLGQYCVTPLASPYQVSILQPSVSLTSSTATPPTGYLFGKSYSATIPSGFTFKNWAFGDGSTRTTTNPDSQWFYASASRLAIVFATGPSGSLTAKEAEFNN